ncbi:MAG: hypothetical protein IJ833_08280 [Lachnospiraceae bacterium]|nr:hypothetical protein [Lachnospiraceae bacterium]
MRKYEQKPDCDLTEVICNKCGKRLEVENGYLREECFSAEHVFGYFSRKDGIKHRFDLCEDCYDHIIAAFRIPVVEEQEVELL